MTRRQSSGRGPTGRGEGQSPSPRGGARAAPGAGRRPGPRFLLAPAAALALLGCASEDRILRREFDAVRASLQALQRDNAELGRRIDLLAARVDELAARPADHAKPEARAAPAPLVPPGLEVVRIEPARTAPAPAARPRTAPPLPTAVPLREPDAETLARIGAPRGDLEAEAEADLAAARRLSGLAASRALEAFAGRFPRHPGADNALEEAARLRDEAGDPEGACALWGRCAEEYPAGDALPEALERVGECHARRGQAERAREIFGRVAADYPDTTAAKRARERLAAMPAATSARQGAAP